MIPKLLLRHEVYSETLESYLARLADQGVKKLGWGYHSAVYQHPTLPNVAVKAVIGDTEYLKFVEFCKRHPDNPWLPKILEGPFFRSLKEGNKSQKIAFVFLEKLKQSDSRQIGRALDSFIALLRKPVGKVSFAGITKKEWQELAVQDKDPHIKNLANFLLSTNMDLHYGNFLMRGQQLVFSDPVSAPV